MQSGSFSIQKHFYLETKGIAIFVDFHRKKKEYNPIKDIHPIENERNCSTAGINDLSSLTLIKFLVSSVIQINTPLIK